MEFEELEKKYNKLKDENLHLIENNISLENTCRKMRVSIAEFFTLQEIQRAIGTILNINELLSYVNDIIIGVLGVSSCSIVTYDEKKDKFEIHVTSVTDQKELAVLKNNLNCQVLTDVLNNNKPIIENNINPDIYKFTEDREIGSLICAPLAIKSKKFGIVIVELKFKYSLIFDQDKLRLMDIIAQQVSIAMENADLYQKMHEIAITDNLTEVYNRVYFNQRLQEEIEKANSSGYELSLAILDIDHFKKFNDTYGHLFGDKVLKSVSSLIKDYLRKTDIIARFGGEEFVILFPETMLDDAYNRVEDLRKLIESHTVNDGGISASITASFGISAYPICNNLGNNPERELIKNADNALYMAKEFGRNCVKVANECNMDENSR